jgi:hypothetical protein
MGGGTISGTALQYTAFDGILISYVGPLINLSSSVLSMPSSILSLTIYNFCD